MFFHSQWFEVWKCAKEIRNWPFQAVIVKISTNLRITLWYINMGKLSSVYQYASSHCLKTIHGTEIRDRPWEAEATKKSVEWFTNQSTYIWEKIGAINVENKVCICLITELLLAESDRCYSRSNPTYTVQEDKDRHSILVKQRTPFAEKLSLELIN